MRSAAAEGLTAKTAEYIFTPAGIPRMGTDRPTASKTSRAVPSPPQKTIRSTPASRNARHAAFVSAAPVGVPGW